MTFSNPRNLFYIRLYALLLMGAGLGLAVVISKHGSLNCNRSIDRCQFESGSLLRVERQNFPIQELTGAIIETKTYQDRYKRVFTSDRVALLPSRTLLIEHHWAGKQPQQIVTEINTFVQDSQQQSLQVSQDERFVGILGGICLIFAGMAILKRSQQT
jgi:hypothetical protein